MPLIASFNLGQIASNNHIVMASMTRGRATNPGHIPDELRVGYYGQRVSVDLILTEGTRVGRDADGVINMPGLFKPRADRRLARDHRRDLPRGSVILGQFAHSTAISPRTSSTGFAPFSGESWPARVHAGGVQGQSNVPRDVVGRYPMDDRRPHTGRLQPLSRASRQPKQAQSGDRPQSLEFK